jgi:recombination protein RecA
MVSMPSEIDALIATINRKAKEDVLVRGSDLRHLTWQRATTGSLALDLALGGGWPLNCWNEIIGNESSGKTAMILKTIAAQQALIPTYHTLWVASEDFDPSWATTLGVDVDRITFVMTNVMELAYDAALAVMEERATDAVVIDSYPALVPSDEDEKSMMELTVGRGAYFTNKFMRKSYAAMRRSLSEYDRPVLGLFVNQWRERIGVFQGDPRITPGGKGKNYSFLTRVEVARMEWITNSAKLKVGQVIKTKAVKNKTAPPQREAIVDFYFDDHKEHDAGSYDTLKQVHAVALVIGVLEQSGSWYKFRDRKWHGEDKVLADMRDDQLLTAALTNEVRHILLGEPLVEPEPEPKRRRTVR